MRKFILIWAAASAVMLSLPQISPAQSQRSFWRLGGFRADKRLESRRNDVTNDAESAPDFERLADHSDDGAMLLAGLEDPLSPLPEPSEPTLNLNPDSEECLECYEFWEHRNALWGEYLYLHPRGADVTYATPVDGTLSTSVPIGPQSVAAFGYNSGFRVGGAWAIDSCSSFTTNYTWYQASNSDSVALPGGGSFLRADTVHPSTVNVAADSLAAQALYDFRLQSIDLNYKAILWGSDYYAVNYLFGLKYVHLDQQFGAMYSILGTTTVNTNVDYNGLGPRFGLEGERLLGDCGLLVYSKAAVNLLFGSNSASYLQQNVFTGVQAQTSLRETRIVTVPEFELGAGWQSCSGRFRLTAGYYVAAWFNMMTTPEYLSTVRESPNSFDRQVKTLTLDGLNARAEWRF